MSHSLICCFLVQILAIGIRPCHQTRVIPQIIYMVTRCGTPHRTIYLAWLVRLNLKESEIWEMNLWESTYRQDEFTRKYTSFWLSRVTREMMGRKVWPLRLANKLGVTSEIKWRQGLTFWKFEAFLAIKCGHWDDIGKKGRTSSFLHRMVGE